MYLADQWKSFEVLDAGEGMKLERWGEVYLLRPDPQAIWPAAHTHEGWEKLHARYQRSSKGGGEWEYLRKMPTQWNIEYKNLSFIVKPLSFKHTGLFPEQAVNWDWMQERLQGRERPKVLNLFAYTGGASVACAAAGAEVTHVDAAKGMVQWAGENARQSGIPQDGIRYIIDDCLKFVKREQRRGHTYEGILMDPPAYGRGPGGELWKLEDNVFELITEASRLLSDDACFFLINSYTTGLGAATLENMLKIAIVPDHGGICTADEVCLPVTDRGIILPCGNAGRWQR